ncbi:MAG: SDR family oxidoreductase [Candidatus Omnitrophica bacterium]|nr:SDR family oxidoreductase [Candidatus Omnitrophota bacterium]
MRKCIDYKQSQGIFGKKFLVTGGAGFIGSHIVERLLATANFVRVLDNFSSGKRDNLRFTEKLNNSGVFELVKGDIRSLDTCRKVTKGIDFVLHQAALRSVPKSMSDPRLYNEVNIGGTLNMLTASAENRVKCFVFASSSSVYGEVKEFPEREDFIPRPISPYALTKLTGEHYCRIFSKFYGLPTVSLRYFNVFGERQSLDDEYAVVIPKFITCILKDKPPPIYGTGKQSRDFTYVRDVVDANILAAKLPYPKGEVFNIASGKDYTVLELVNLLNKIMHKKIKPVFLKPRPGDVFKTHADLSMSKKYLKFKPGFNFMEGLKLTVDYFKEKEKL